VLHGESSREDPWPQDRVRSSAQPGPSDRDDSRGAAIEAVVDDPDEETLADPIEPEDEPTTLRPSTAALALWEAATVNAGRVPARPRRRVGKYELQTRLARGAFGVVYTARDPSLERTVAIKVLRATHLASHEIVQRFLQEARATARIAHPGIVTIHDCGMVETRRGSTAFIAMELLSGQSLTSRLARTGRLAPAEACEVARQVASALEAAHHVDVLHRDLKPDNIFLVPDPAMPSGERVKVLDFGLAKLGAGGHTQLQTVFGTPRYMSPEQSRSATQIDHRSDIYSLGCVLFELVTGRTPFDGDVRQLIERHQRATPPRASTLVSDLPCALDELIADMLAKAPLDRPQTMGAVQRVLRFATEGPAADDPPSITARSEPPAALVMPLPPGTPSPLPAAAAHPRPPSSPPAPQARPPSSHDARARYSSSLAEAALRPPSTRTALPAPSRRRATSRPDGPAPVVVDLAPGRPASLDADRPTAADAVSGEVVVPAAAIAAAAAAVPAFPDELLRRQAALFYVCVVVIAVVTAIALAIV